MVVIFCVYALVIISISIVFVCFFKQKTAYEMRISDWSSDVCSSDLQNAGVFGRYAAAQCLPKPVINETLAVGHRRVLGRRQRRREFEHLAFVRKIGSASCRERVCQYV